MQNQVKKIVELYGAKSIKEIIKMKDITIIPSYKEDSVVDFERVEIKFKEEKGVSCFVICVDREYYLKYNSEKKIKFMKGEARAIHFQKDAEKKTYPSILSRAMESVAIVLQGKFEKEIDIGDE